MVVFSCIEQMNALVGSARLPFQLTQLQPGTCRGDLLPLVVGPLSLMRFRFNRRLHVSGDKPSGQQLICLSLDPPRHQEVLRCHGHELPEASVFGLAPEIDVHLTVPSPACVAIVAIERSEFLRRATELGDPRLADRGGFSANWLSIDPLRHEGIRRYVLQLFAMAEQELRLLGEPGWIRLVNEDLVPLLVEACVGHDGERGFWPRRPARIDLVKTTQRWMAEHPDLPVTLEVLCREVFAGRRTLIQGFREHLGMGPMAYLKTLRLHAVRRHLLAMDPDDTTISAVATRWGFLNAGHFAGDYRRLFDELPSQTLARSLTPI